MVDSHVIVLLKLVQPNLCKSHQVAFECIAFKVPCIRAPLAKHVTNMWTRDCLKRTATHPRFKGQFKILPTPYVEAWVVGAKFSEVLTADGEQTSCHSRGSGRSVGSTVTLCIRSGYNAASSANFICRVKSNQDHVGISISYYMYIYVDYIYILFIFDF